MHIVMSFTGLCLLLLLGKWARVKFKFLQRLYLPSSVIGGLLGLIFLQLMGSTLPAAWTAGWDRLPGFLINIVFSALFLGVVIPSFKTIWQKSAPQLAYGQIIAWGQWFFGIGAVMLILSPIFKLNDFFGSVLPIGFEGGHGTAAGLADTFTRLGWKSGGDFALASATGGIITAIIVGIALINWAAKKGHIKTFKPMDQMSDAELAGIFPDTERPSAGKQTVSADSIDSLAFHLSIIGLAILIGFGLKTGLAWAEEVIFKPQDMRLFAGFPLFPLCMIGGLITQLSFTKFSKAEKPPIDHGLMQRLAGTALDFLVVSAIATIKLSVIAKGLIPLIILIVIGALWNVFCVLVLAKRMLPTFWFERAIAEMGKSMGVTATGLLLLRIVDPEQKTDAPQAFGYKQLIHEPFMGGGLWTSTAVLLIASYGGWLIVGISGAAIIFWWLFWRFLLKK
ncbi:sodium:glutamate symporter [bacterium]|nr:sodium:glutamate symporter [bacterium]